MYLKQTDCFITRCALFQPCEEANKVSVIANRVSFFFFRDKIHFNLKYNAFH